MTSLLQHLHCIITQTVNFSQPKMDKIAFNLQNKIKTSLWICSHNHCNTNTPKQVSEVRVKCCLCFQWQITIT